MRLFQYSVEHWAEVAGGAVDDPQHLGSRGLLLQGLARLDDQPRILHRDNRLRREALHQRDLLLGERANLPAVNDESAEQSVVLRKRHGQSSARTAQVDESTAKSLAGTVGVLRSNIEDMNDLLSGSHARESIAGPGSQWPGRQEFGIGSRYPPQGRGPEGSAVIGAQNAETGFTQVGRLFEQGIKHRREITRRAVDDLQYLCGRGLLL